MTTITNNNNVQFDLGELPLDLLATAIRRRIVKMLSEATSEELVQLINEGMKAVEEEEPRCIIPIFTPDELDTILHACWMARKQAQEEAYEASEDGDYQKVGDETQMVGRIGTVIERINFSSLPKTETI